MIHALFLSTLIANQITQSIPKPQMVTFPDMVTKTPMQEPEVADQPELAQALQELDQNTSVTNTQYFAATFNTHPISPHHIQIPENGNFDLVLKQGSQFKITDKDATDGSATIELPKGTFNTYLHLSGQHRQSSQLAIEDPLYHVKDSIKAKRWGRWLRLGNRPIPIPTDWRSPDGNTLVLKMTAKEVKHFYILWLKTNKQAPFPPGIKEIGPEGGTVELPGVGKIELPPGALSEKITVKLSQEKEVPIIQDSFSTSGKLEPIDFIGPVLKIEPTNYTLSKNGKVYVNTNLERLGTNDPNVIFWMHTRDLDDINNFETIGGLGSPSSPTKNSPIEFSKFGYISKLIFSSIQPDSAIKGSLIGEH